MQSTTTTQLDKKYYQKLQSALLVAQQWDADPALLREARLMIPHDLLTNSLYKRDEDHLYQSSHPNLLYLKRLCVWFQSIMTWVNQPDCSNCKSGGDTKKAMKLIHMRGPQSPEEFNGGASNVEVYQCQNCTTTTPFPRYNAVHKLLQTLSGRCGEYANLFGLFCRAAGYNVRYVVDYTDHVWVECCIYNGNTTDSWIMADGCEGIIRKPSMYEDGWGKELVGMVAATQDSVYDVTPRYTRKWNTTEFQQKRRSTVVSSEQQAQSLIQQLNQTLRQHLSKSRVEELVRLEQQEQKWMEVYKSAKSWTEEEKHGKGRISGSLEWKLARQEAGKQMTATNNKEDDNQKKGMYALSVESFYPPLVGDKTTISITVSSERGIVVSGVACAVEEAPIAVVVVDQHYLGCILQSRGFEKWADVSAFVDTLPNERIVVLKGALSDGNEPPKLPRLVGFVVPSDTKETTVLYIGQVEAHPDWCVCSTENDAELTVRLPAKRPDKPLKLRVEPNTVPRRVATRLPENIMPLGTQLLASDDQKRTAFAKFVQQTSKSSSADRHRYSGYATKDKAPVYLLDEDSFPFESSEAGWTTCHFLPEELVPDTADGGVTNEGVVTTVASSSPSTPSFDVPVNSEFFTQLLGPYLLTQSKDLLGTTSALSHARLVAFYFSAHWCGPCRQFTPMLAEMYDVLKENIRTHGLEIVFVSSDRDPGSFSKYYGTMPWLAVPYELGIDTIIPHLKAKFGVRGIPSLVVLDTVSGQIVVPTSQTRQEVMKACQGGEDRIEEMFQDWLTRVPPETKELVEMLEMSCQEDKESVDEENSYLVRKEGDSKGSSNAPPVDMAERIKELFSQLVVDGEDPNKAAAKAIKMVAEEQKTASMTKSYGPGSLSGLALVPSDVVETTTATTTVDKAIANITAWNAPDGKDALQAVVSTAQKYVENARKEPWNPKFRTMKLANKVVDRIVRVEGGLGLLLSLGLYVYPSEQDMMACIPLSVDLDGLYAQMEKILEKLGDE